MRVTVHIFVRKLAEHGIRYTNYSFMRSFTADFETFDELQKQLKAYTYFTPDTITINNDPRETIVPGNFHERLRTMQIMQSRNNERRLDNGLYLCARYTSPERRAPIETGEVFTVLDSMHARILNLESMPRFECPSTAK